MYNININDEIDEEISDKNMGKGGNAKHWVGTCNNYTEAWLLNFNKAEDLCEYFVWGREVGARGTPHIQFYVCFHTKQRFKKVSTLFPNSWLACKKKMATPLRASNYCKKGDLTKAEWDIAKKKDPFVGRNADFTEHGSLPANQGDRGGESMQETYANFYAQCKLGDIHAVDNKELLVKHFGNAKAIAKEFRPMPKKMKWPIDPVTNQDLTPNIWIWGPSGTGKTHHADNPELLGLNYREDQIYTKEPTSPYWEDYKGEPYVIISDLGKDSKEYNWCTFMKNVADKKPFFANAKFAGMWTRPEVIVVTSNFSIKEIFDWKQTWQPMERRFRQIHLDTVYVRPAVEPVPVDDFVNPLIHDMGGFMIDDQEEFDRHGGGLFTAAETLIDYPDYFQSLDDETRRRITESHRAAYQAAGIDDILSISSDEDSGEILGNEDFWKQFKPLIISKPKKLRLARKKKSFIANKPHLYRQNAQGNLEAWKPDQHLLHDEDCMCHVCIDADIALSYETQEESSEDLSLL